MAWTRTIFPSSTGKKKILYFAVPQLYQFFFFSSSADDNPKAHPHGAQSPYPVRKNSKGATAAAAAAAAAAENRGEVEYFFASDASAIIEHTDRVMYLEDDDVASVKGGRLSLHRVKRNVDDNANRCVRTPH